MYESLEEWQGITIGQNVYIADIMPFLDTYEVIPCHIRNIRSNGKDTYFVALEETKECRSRLFKPKDIDVYVFLTSYEAEMAISEAKEDNKDLVVKLTVSEEADENDLCE